MTTLTIVSKAAFVNIVLSMARDATGLQLRRIAGFCMAGRTDQAFMLSGQGKFRRDIVIEFPDLPAIDGMAAHAA